MENSDGGAAKLEQFLILAKSARDKAAVALVKNVLTNKIYVFGELLEQPNIAAVSVPQPFLQRTHHTQNPTRRETHRGDTFPEHPAAHSKGRSPHSSVLIPRTIRALQLCARNRRPGFRQKRGC